MERMEEDLGKKPETEEEERDLENLEILRLLREYVQHGYLLHGSPRQLPHVSPDDVSGAVEATPEVLVALARALLEQADPLGYGYVHVLPADDFKLESDEHGIEKYAAHEVIVPVAILPVRPEIMGLLDRLDED